MSSLPPPSPEPHARGSVIHGFREAIVDLWGEAGLAAMASRLPIDTRVATVDALVMPFEWVPIDHVIAWHDAMWAEPCAGDEEALARLVARSIELGFRKFKAAFFAGITPDRLLTRAPELWRWQHTHGQLSASYEGNAGIVVLRDHPYVDYPSSRRVTAESFRHIVSFAGARDARAAWGERAERSYGRPVVRELVVQLFWRTGPA